MILYCRHCSHVWMYGGEAQNETSCPSCKGYVNLTSQRLDEPIGELGDYGGAEYLGVAEDGTAHYWDQDIGLAVWYAPETDRLEEISDSQDMTPMEYVLYISEVMGWRYIRPMHEIQKLTKFYPFL